MRKIASKFLFNWLPSAVATFIGGLALHLYLMYLQPPVTSAASPILEVVPATSAPMTMARPNEAAPVTVSESGRSSTPDASEATVKPKGRPVPQRSPAAAAPRKRPYNAAIVLDPRPSENAKTPAGSRLTAPEPTIGAPVPIVEEPSASEVPIVPQPFPISELKQKLGGIIVER